VRASLRVAASQPRPSCRPSPVSAQAPTARDVLFLRSYRPRRCPTSEGLIVTFTSFWQESSKKSFIRDWPMPQFAKRCFALRRLRFFCSRSIGLCCYTGDLCIYVRVDGGCQPVMQTTTPLCSCISLCSTHLDRTVPT
jgi:hypothetical protein